MKYILFSKKVPITVHELYTYPLTLTAVLKGCVMCIREKIQLNKKTIAAQANKPK